MDQPDEVAQYRSRWQALLEHVPAPYRAEWQTRLEAASPRVYLMAGHD